jgi:hypothetical protein
MIMFREGLFKIDEEAEKAAKRYSIIHWKIEEPKENGMYLITTIEGKIAISTFIKGNTYDEQFFNANVTAWCKLNDISPYKEGKE